MTDKAEMKWTPGPWLIDQGSAHSGCIATIFNTDPEYTEVWSRAWMEVGNGPEVGNANANLIAAAPDLYQVLADIVEFVAVCTDEDGNPTVEISQHDDFSDARKALAKARGEKIAKSQ